MDALLIISLEQFLGLNYKRNTTSYGYDFSNFNLIFINWYVID